MDPAYDALIKSIYIIVANPLQIKIFQNDKSDFKDLKRIATRCLNRQIRRSCVFTEEDRDLMMMKRDPIRETLDGGWMQQIECS